MARNKPVFRVYQRSDGLWEWQLLAINNRVLATSHSQGFGSRRDAVRAVLSVIAAVAKAEVR